VDPDSVQARIHVSGHHATLGGAVDRFAVQKLSSSYMCIDFVDEERRYNDKWLWIQ